MRGIEQKDERRFEYIRHFERIRRKPERRLNPADDRRDAVPRHGLIVRELAQNFDALAIKADFLRRFAQCCGGMIGVLRFDAPTWTADLTGVIGKLRATLR